MRQNRKRVTVSLLVGFVIATNHTHLVDGLKVCATTFEFIRVGECNVEGDIGAVCVQAHTAMSRVVLDEVRFVIVLALDRARHAIQKFFDYAHKAVDDRVEQRFHLRDGLDLRPGGDGR